MGEEEESDEEENSSARNGRGVELLTNEYASRHEENRTTATTKDSNMKRKLEVRFVRRNEIRKSVLSSRR